MQRTKPKRTEQGMTLMECLMGIVVITIVIAAITPPLLISMATRVQNYRAQQAMKLAVGELDRVRLEVESGGSAANWQSKLPPQASGYDITKVGAPTTKVPTQTTCPLTGQNGADPTTTWCGADINGDGDWDLGVQTFRTPTPATTGNPKSQPIAFVMGVRVYTRSAIESGKPLETTPVNLGLTSGYSVSKPLVSISTPIVRSNLNISAEAYCNLYKSMGVFPQNGECPGD
ncbi:MAG: prepilin-type N-terminal cleavage/methylation domain-containing protein [Oscillatoria princeps RMCB-10]|jgi:prepilin-type N-terminal cleavage/methylation domain-containing protein|nr:prepilin-type N-terminal cleavage/methylation domain-containing protein [Oscillatoria princeps RMCB-10]